MERRIGQYRDLDLVLRDSLLADVYQFDDHLAGLIRHDVSSLDSIRLVGSAGSADSGERFQQNEKAVLSHVPQHSAGFWRNLPFLRSLGGLYLIAGTQVGRPLDDHLFAAEKIAPHADQLAVRLPFSLDGSPSHAIVLEDPDKLSFAPLLNCRERAKTAFSCDWFACSPSAAWAGN